jgi:hypothetical protein
MKKQDMLQGTLSQSGLPPLASGKFNTQTKIVVEDTTSDNGGVKQSKTNRLPTDFNLNIAESANSIDFDISDSHRGATFVSQNSLPMGQNLSSGVKEGSVGRRNTYNPLKKRLDDLEESQEYMDSGDY